MSDLPACRRIRAVSDRLARAGVIVVAATGETHAIFPIAISADERDALRRLVMRENAIRTIEIGLGYGLSALAICEGLVANQQPAARHTVIDPFQASRFADCGLQALGEAGVAALVEHYAEKSHLVLPRLLSEGRQFDFAFVDGNHRFDSVFVDLYYLGLLVRRGGVIMLDDYDLPGIQRATAFFAANLNWAIEETAPDWVALRTAPEPDTRHFTHFVEF